MSRTFPVFVLDIVLPFNDVDVNVHPAKAEVRFKDSGLIFGTVFSAVSRALDGGAINLIPDIKLDIPDIIGNIDTVRETAADKHCNSISDNNDNKLKSLDMSSIRSTFKGASGVKESSGITSAEIIERLSQKNEFNQESAISSKIPEFEQIRQEMPNLIDYKIVGQLFDTYLLLEYNGEALMIDQHAAMERINYDRLIASIEKEGSIQNLLVPYILNVNHYESALIEDNIVGFKEIGVEIEPFGNNTYRVSAVPAALGNINLERFFKLAIAEINSGKGLKMNEILRDKLAQAACKASIKGGDKLNDEKIKLLLKNMSDGKIPLQCPHGRPAIIRLTRSELEKWFRRTI
jgi:DNA mismatch repair protein MutL